MKEADLTQMVRPHVPADEEILAVGVFQPRGTDAGKAGSGVLAGGVQVGLDLIPGVGRVIGDVAGDAISTAGNLGSRTAVGKLRGLPRWTVLAVTPTKLYGFAAHRHEGFFGFEIDEPFHTWDRDEIQVRVISRVRVKVFEITELDDNITFQLEGYRFGRGHAEVVMQFFLQEEEPPEGTPHPDDEQPAAAPA